MVTVSGDTWNPSRFSPYVNAVEYFNYTNKDITIVDDFGVETEILGRSENPFDIGDRGYIVIRVTRLVDPRRVNIPETKARNDIDQYYLDCYRAKIEKLRGNITEGMSGYNQCRMTAQFEIRLKPQGNTINYRSDILGVTIKETEDYSVQTFTATPEGYIEKEMISELIDLDHKADNGTDKGVRTIMSARLIDNQKRVGRLWTNMFGNSTPIEPVIDEEQEDGLYLAGGSKLDIRKFIPVSDLLDPKILLANGLFHTELECKKNSTGEYTASVITERDKTKKENRSLKDENTKLSNKVSAMELDVKAEKINKAHNEYKHTRSYDNMKDYYDGNTVASLSRISDKLLAIIKGAASLFAAFKLIRSFI